MSPPASSPPPPPPPLLPTPRQLLTSLLDAIGAIPVPPSHDGEDTQAQQGHYAATLNRAAPGGPTNVLKRMHPSHRPLFATLHVLFPSLLLPALDLLDRGLVTRLVLPPRRSTEGDDDGKTPGAAERPQRTTQRPGAARPRCSYLVRSAQTPMAGARRPYGGATADMPTGGQAYIVHAEAWNCTCAAFAFATFAAGPAPARRRREQQQRPGRELGAEAEAEAGWTFGGLSSDGLDVEGEEGGGGVPCCKHLLACVLAERWPGGLGTYVVERLVTREEMAGIVADV